MCTHGVAQKRHSSLSIEGQGLELVYRPLRRLLDTLFIPSDVARVVVCNATSDLQHLLHFWLPAGEAFQNLLPATIGDPWSSICGFVQIGLRCHRHDVYNGPSGDGVADDMLQADGSIC